MPPVLSTNLKFSAVTVFSWGSAASGWVVMCDMVNVITVDFLILFQTFTAQLFTLVQFHFPLSPHKLSGTIAPFTHFSLFFPIFCSLTHILLSQPVTSLFILIFHPLLRTCMRDIQPARRVSLFTFIPRSCDQSPDRHALATWLRSY